MIIACLKRNITFVYNVQNLLKTLKMTVSSSTIELRITYPGHFILSFLNLFFVFENISCILWKNDSINKSGRKLLTSHVLQAFKYENLMSSSIKLFVGKKILLLLRPFTFWKNFSGLPKKTTTWKEVNQQVIF